MIRKSTANGPFSIFPGSLLPLAGLALIHLVLAPCIHAEKGKPSQIESAQASQAEEKAGKQSKHPAKPSIKSLGDHRYQLGAITFNGKTREIRFPATMNLEEGLLEYAVVHGSGKIHESLLSTEVSAAQLQVVMKLCHYKDGTGDIFDAILPDEDKKGEAGKAERGSAVKIAVEWIEEVDGIEKKNHHPIGDLLVDLKGGKPESPIPSGQWIYNGSLIYEGVFIAESEGTLISVYIDNGALLNSFRPGSDDDERWVTNAKLAPKIGTPITVILSPDKPEFPISK